MLHHFSILFFIYRSKTNIKGDSPINCRITLNGVRKQFAVGNNIKDRFWSSDRQRCKGSSEEAKLINANLDVIERKLNKAYSHLLIEKETLFVEDIYNRFAGNDQKFKTILQVFDYHNEKMSTLIGKDYVQATYNKFVVIQNHVKEFIKYQYRKTDFPLNEIKLSFLVDLDYYTRSALSE